MLLNGCTHGGMLLAMLLWGAGLRRLHSPPLRGSGTTTQPSVLPDSPAQRPSLSVLSAPQITPVRRWRRKDRSAEGKPPPHSPSRGRVPRRSRRAEGRHKQRKGAKPHRGRESRCSFKSAGRRCWARSRAALGRNPRSRPPEEAPRAGAVGVATRRVL